MLIFIRKGFIGGVAPYLVQMSVNCNEVLHALALKSETPDLIYDTFTLYEFFFVDFYKCKNEHQSPVHKILHSVLRRCKFAMNEFCIYDFGKKIFKSENTSFMFNVVKKLNSLQHRLKPQPTIPTKTTS